MNQIYYDKWIIINYDQLFWISLNFLGQTLQNIDYDDVHTTHALHACPPNKKAAHHCLGDWDLSWVQHILHVGLELLLLGCIVQRETSINKITINNDVDDQCRGDGKTAWEAILQRVAYIGICFTEDHATLLNWPLTCQYLWGPGLVSNQLDVYFRWSCWWKGLKASVGKVC